MRFPISHTRRCFAGALVALAIVNATVMPDAGHLLAMCSGLCSAWVLAFVPAPPLGNPLVRVKSWIEEGRWRLATSARLMVVLAVLLHLAACVALAKGK